MKITEIKTQNNLMEDIYYTLKVNGKSMLEVFNMSDCPEDVILSRGLRFVYQIADLMALAYEAGKNGEKLEIESIAEVDE